ncbi:hypothetical protein D3C73_1537030 [compost metagenome]
MTANNSKELHILNVKNMTPAVEKSLIELENCKSANVQSCFPSAGTGVFLDLVGSANEEIYVQGNNLARVKQVLRGTYKSGQLTSNINPSDDK